ncbi:hypothetical protein GCM10011415_06410 [Salipiger pallidus]|uniref:Uncharacterized protein n=1 Tax=Salipiger pallidus TaxID=1775170 RepID=A0A8J2ZGX4_9RHOB|nr:hypothetical protein [Salipiger pallidus]GGG62764.1 hypothetical protein GCM10011415_06410 [Salipiger pallidus]
MDEERLIVALEARIRDFEKNMLKAEQRGTQSYNRLRTGSRTATTAMEADMLRSTSRINQALATTSTRIGAFGKAFVAGAVVAGIGAITTGATQAVRALSEIQQQADRAGLSVTAFQELKFVSEQSRIDVDAMVDGLKELQLRADEFIVTGKGSGEEAFRRLGYSAEDLKRRLEEPEELFLDLIDRMEDLDRAAQIRVADEVFGGTGGERFVELLRQGDDGIRQMMDRAHELGLVIEEDTIAKAAELDRKFGEITGRISTLAKTIVVDLAGALDEALTIDVDDIFGSAERAIAMMGEKAYRDAMEGKSKATEEEAEEQMDTLRMLRDEYARLGDEAVRLFPSLDQTIISLSALGYSDAADTLRAVRDQMAELDDGLKDGTISAEDFDSGMQDAITSANDALAQIDAIDGATFSNVIAQLGGLARALIETATRATQLRNSLPGNEVGTTPAPEGEVDFQLPPTETAPRSSVRPQMPGVNFSFGRPEPSAGGGGGGSSGGGGGGRARAEVDDFRREVERTREEIARLEAEAVALAAVAETGFEYGDAVDYARKKAELLYEAQAAGKELTPEMRAEIDQLAQAYAKAGQAADDAADKMDKVRENTERGAQSMSDLFMSVLDGSSSAEQALWSLVQQLIQVQIEAAFLDLAKSGGTVGSIFEAIGSALSGKRAEGGPVKVGEPYLVNERTANSEIFVPSQSGAILNVPQAQAALREAVLGGRGKRGGTPLPRSLRKMAAASSEPVMPRIEGARANGGSVMSGKSYLTNERTSRAEVFTSSQSGAILNVPQAQAALRGASAGQSKIEVAAPVVNIPVNVAPLPGETAEVTRQPNGTMDIRMIRKVLRDELSSGSMDGAMRRRYGGRPLPKGS